MEVKRLVRHLTQKGKVITEEIVKEFYENKEDGDNDFVLKFLRTSSNLSDLKEHNESAIIQSINKRIGYGVPYTFAGKDLISINCDYPGFWFFNNKLKSLFNKENPHPYSISLNSYIKLRETQENQVICLVGASGSGKTFNTIHLLDHLIDISTEQQEGPSNLFFELVHKSIQLLHIMGSAVKKHNLESTTCAFDVSVNFDKEFRFVGAKIQASLMDSSLPTHKKGRSYQILHSIFYSDKDTLKHLGLSKTIPYKIFGGTINESFKIFDNEVNLRFFECFQFLQVASEEKKRFLETLACVIHLYEVEFVGKNDKIEPKTRSFIKKNCKFLGIQESFFIEKFFEFSDKDLCNRRAKDLARFLYEKAFVWLNRKINEKLDGFMKSCVKARKNLLTKDLDLTKEDRKIIKLELQPRYKISILDFPGFTKEKTLGGLSVNLAFESLNYYCSSNYIKLLKKLSSQRIKVMNLQECRSKSVVEYFMKNEANFMHSIALPDGEYKKFKKLIKSNKSDVVSLEEENDLEVNFSWGTVKYNLAQLRNEALQHFYPDFNASLLKKSSSCIINSINNEASIKNIRLGTNFEEVYMKRLRKILMPHLEIEPFVIYCIKTDTKSLTKAALSTIRSTLILPNLIWHWFGYPHWVKIKDLSAEVSLNLESLSKQRIKAELEKTFKWTDFEVTDHYVLLKPNHMKDFKALIEKKYRTPEQSISDLSMSLSLFSSSPDKDFNLTIHDDSTKIEESFIETVFYNSFVFVDIDKFFPEQAESGNLSTREQSRMNSNQNDSVTHTKTKEKFNLLQNVKILTMADIKQLSYNESLDKIIKIQKVWRGSQSRAYTNALKTLNDKAKIIQKVWKGFSIRKQMKPILVLHRSACKIQKIWKIFWFRKKNAAKKIQKWFRRVLDEKKEALTKIQELATMKNNKKKSKGFEQQKIQEFGKLKPTAKKIISNNVSSEQQRVKSHIKKNIKVALKKYKHEMKYSNQEKFFSMSEENYSESQERPESSEEKNYKPNEKFSSTTSKDYKTQEKRYKNLEKSYKIHEKSKNSRTQEKYSSNEYTFEQNSRNHENFSSSISENYDTKSEIQGRYSPNILTHKYERQENQRTYSPIISEKSKQIAKSKNFQFENLSLFERFKILEANRIENIHKQRQKKIEKESFSHKPSINESDTIKNTFEQRQEVYMKNYKLKKDQRVYEESDENCTFKPMINSSLSPRNHERTVEQLYIWAKNKENKLNKAREAKLENEKEDYVGFKISNTSLNYSINRKNKKKEEEKVSHQIKRESSPYWPTN